MLQKYPKKVVISDYDLRPKENINTFVFSQIRVRKFFKIGKKYCKTFLTRFNFLNKKVDK